MSRRHQPVEEFASVPILCKFWHEDDVWNGVAIDLPIAVFGDKFEEAMENLREALVSHLEAMRRAGKIKQAVSHLRQKAKDYGFLSPDELSENSPIVKMLVSVQNRRAALNC